MTRKNFLVACIAAVAINEVAANRLTTADSSSHGQGQGQSPALIQTFVASVDHHCTFAQDRNKAALPDFAAIEMGSELYVDPDFKPDNNSLFWADYGEQDADGSLNKAVWLRASEQYPRASIFGSKGLSKPEDIYRDDITYPKDNLWFLSAAASLAVTPARIEKIFQNSGSGKNANGIYAVNFYTLGVPHTVIIDDYMPNETLWNGDKPMFTKIRGDSLWPLLLEKAFAKYHGNYQHIRVGKDSTSSMRALTNAPSFTHIHSKSDKQTIWKLLEAAALAGNIMQAKSIRYRSFDLRPEIFYSLLEVKTLSTSQRVLKLRNPQGKEYYRGTSITNKWVDEWDEVGGFDLSEIQHDGVFWIPFEDFFDNFEHTAITHNTEGWHSSHFLMLDDKQQDTGVSTSCGVACARHEMTLTSDVDQTVYVSAQTWDSLRADCKKTSGTLRHNVSVEGQVSHGFDDNVQMPPFEMKAGQTLRLETEWAWPNDMDWSNPPINNDWSTLVWGDKGPITIKHNKGYKSMSLPVIYGKGKSPSALAESKYSKALQTKMSTWKPVMRNGNACDGDFKYGDLERTSDGQHEWMMVGNTCPDTVFIFSLWMKTEDWAGVEFYKEFDAQGNMIAHTTPVQCFVAYWHPDETTCEWLVGDPNHGGVPRVGYVQAQGNNDGFVHHLFTWTVGAAH